MWFDEFFESKCTDLYYRGIEQLVNNWQEVVNNEGEYTVE